MFSNNFYRRFKRPLQLFQYWCTDVYDLLGSTLFYKFVFSSFSVPFGNKLPNWWKLLIIEIIYHCTSRQLYPGEEKTPDTNLSFLCKENGKSFNAFVLLTSTQDHCVSFLSYKGKSLCVFFLWSHKVMASFLQAVIEWYNICFAALILIFPWSKQINKLEGFVVWRQRTHTGSEQPGFQSRLLFSQK